MHLLQAHHNIKNSVDETAVNIQHPVTPPCPTLAHPVPLSHPWVFRTLVVYPVGVMRADSMSAGCLKNILRALDSRWVPVESGFWLGLSQCRVGLAEGLAEGLVSVFGLGVSQ